MATLASAWANLVPRSGERSDEDKYNGVHCNGVKDDGRTLAMAKCLSESEIEMFLAGAIQLDASAEAHLADCSDCREAVQLHRADRELFQEIKLAFRENDFHSRSPVGLGPSFETEVSSETPSPEGIEPIEGYQILAELHRGGQGVVYKATQKATKRPVALKLLLQGPFATSRQRARFEREIDLVATLKHPNIVTVYDSGISHGRLFYAMEYIHGEPLDQYLRSRGAFADTGEEKRHHLPILDTLKLFHKICVAVGYAQQHGVIHRDLKPANILIDAAGEPHVLDFGLAKTIAEEADDGRLTATGEFLGTLAYASPEQATADPQRIDVRSDVYSLGVILFEMLTGQFPYSIAGPLSEVLHQITDTVPRRPSSIRKEIDGEIDSIALMALAKEPERRYQSAERLALDIQHYLNREPIDAKRDSTWYVIRKSLRRHRAAMFTAAAFCMVVAGAFGVSMRLWYQATADRDSAKTAESNEKAARVAETEARLAEKKQREEAEFQSYIANVAAADQALRAHDVVDARQRLERAPKRLRNWEWFHLQQRLDASRQTLQGHASYVNHVMYSPDGEWLASSEMGGSICIWSTHTGALLRKLQHGQSVTSLRISPDGKLLAAAGKGPNISLWNVANGWTEAELSGPSSQIRDIAFSADGRQLVSVHGNLGNSSTPEGAILFWNITSGIQDKKLSAPAVISKVRLHPDGSRIAVTASSQIELRDVASGKTLRTFSGEGAVANAVEFSPDGLRLMAAWNDGTVRVWDVNSDDEQGRYSGHTGSVEHIAFSDDGSRFVTASRDKTVRLWDAASGTPIAVFCGHTWKVTSVAFSPDGNEIASASWDMTVKRWSAIESDEVTTLHGHTRHASGVAINTDGTHLATSSWDQTVRIWDATSLQLLTTLEGHQGPVQCVSINPHPNTSRWLASGSWDQTIRLWNPDSPKDVRVLTGHTDRVQGLTFSPDGKWLVSGSRDNTIRFWNADTGEAGDVLMGHVDHIHCVAFSPNGRLLASSGHETIKLWDVATRAEVASLPRTIVQEDYSLAFHPDGRRLAAGSDYRMLYVWELDERKPIAKLPNHTDEINSVAFTSDGSRLASASVDGSVRIWDVATWTEITSLSGFTGHVNSIIFGPQDSWLVGALSNGTIKIWRGASPRNTNKLAEKPDRSE